MFCKNRCSSQNLQENTCAWVSFLRDSGTGVFQWILRNFQEHLFYRTPLGDCLCICGYSSFGLQLLNDLLWSCKYVYWWNCFSHCNPSIHINTTYLLTIKQTNNKKSYLRNLSLSYCKNTLVFLPPKLNTLKMQGKFFSFVFQYKYNQ